MFHLKKDYKIIKLASDPPVEYLIMLLATELKTASRFTGNII